MPAATTFAPCFPDSATASLSRLIVRPHDRAHPERGRAEMLARTAFARAYGARLDELAPDLLGFWRGGELVGVVGLRTATAGRLFSERYLESTLDVVLATALGRTVSRAEVCEIGNLAVPCPGEARAVYAALAIFLFGAGFRWLVCTAVMPLYHCLRRAGFGPIALAPAIPERLGPEAAAWGSYYDAGALVCCGSIQAAYARLTAPHGTRPSARNSPERAAAATAGTRQQRLASHQHPSPIVRA